MNQDQANVHEIECRLRQRVRHNVVPTDIQVGLVECFEKAGIDVSRNDITLRAYLVAEPIHNAAAATADLQAPPARRDTEVGEIAHGARIIDCGEGRKARRCLRPRVVKDVAAVG